MSLLTPPKSVLCTGWSAAITIRLLSYKPVRLRCSKCTAGRFRCELDSWQRGVSVPFFDNAGNTYLANPDGSEDRVKLDRHTRTYRVLRRTAAPGRGRYAYLIAK